MFIADSSIWINAFNRQDTPEVALFHTLLDNETMLVGDLIMTEVLQGFSAQKDFDEAYALMSAFPFVHLGGKEIAIQAAKNYRILRKKGITVRKTIDVLIGTACIYYGVNLLYSDKDFDPMVEHLGLRVPNM